MLARTARLTRSTDFSEVVRHGRRSSCGSLTVHLLGADPPSGPARAGLVVSRSVGGSVARHAVARRLRHLLRDRVPALPAGSRLVVRAAPGAATASSQVLGADLDAALERAQRPRSVGGARTAR